MSKIENITCDDVKDIIRLACPTGTYDGRITELTKAGALICAEIDRLIRVKEWMEGEL